jgi:hypothetical protein
MRTHPIALVLFSFLIAACSDRVGPDGKESTGNEPSMDGILIVSTSTEGGDPDPDGYRLVVDGANVVPLAPSATIALVLPSGRHALRLLDVAEHCSVASDSPVEVALASRDTVAVAFDVSCPGRAAMVTASTSGLDIDEDGYGVLVDEVERMAIQANQTVRIHLAPDSRTIALRGLSSNCTTGDSASRTLNLVPPGIVSIDFAVTCTARSGVVGIVIKTTGLTVSESFDAKLDGLPALTVALAPVQALPRQPQYVTGVPAGNHIVSLSDSPDCSVETGPRHATVTVGGNVRDTVLVSFSATCSLPPESVGYFRISAPTVGRVPPATRYTIRSASYGYWDYGYGEWFALGTLAPNDTLVVQAVPIAPYSGAVWRYKIELIDLPAGCDVHPPPPNNEDGYAVAAGDTLDLEFAVSCQG